MFVVRDVATVVSHIQRRIRLAVLSIGVSEFAYEVRLVSAFGPLLTAAFRNLTSDF